MNNDIDRKFFGFVNVWRSDTADLSDLTLKCTHPAYKEIIRLGKKNKNKVLPLIFAELQESRLDWFFALRKITGENPVRKSHRGKVPLMMMDWLEWREKKGIGDGKKEY